MSVNSVTIDVPVEVMPIELEIPMALADMEIGTAVEFSDMAVEIPIELGQTVVEYIGDTNPYTGIYTVSPDFEGITLETNRKYMTDDVEVNPIQVESVTNLSGGTTVYIGGTINYGE